MKRPLLLTLLAALAVLASVAIVAPAFGAPAVQEAKPVIAQPGEGSVVRDVVQIIGTATHPQFQRYELYYAPYPVPSDQSWIFIGDAHNNQQPLGLLGNWDSRSVPDGAYALRVRVVKLDGNYIDSDLRQVRVANTGPVDTPTPAGPETPLPELPPTDTAVDATAVVEPPTAEAPGFRCRADYRADRHARSDRLRRRQRSTSGNHADAQAFHGVGVRRLRFRGRQRDLDREPALQQQPPRRHGEEGRHVYRCCLCPGRPVLRRQGPARLALVQDQALTASGPAVLSGAARKRGSPLPS